MKVFLDDIAFFNAAFGSIVHETLEFVSWFFSSQPFGFIAAC